MRVRYYRDPSTGEPHICGHSVEEDEVEDVLDGPLEDRPGRDASRVAVGRTRGGRFLRVIYVPDAEPESVFVITAYPLSGKPLRGFSTPAQKEGQEMKQSRFPAGWDEKRVREVLEHYEGQSEDEAVAEDEAAYEDAGQTIMEVPTEIVPAVRELIAKHLRRTELS